MGLFETLVGIFAGSRQAEEQAQALQTMSDYITQQTAQYAQQITEQMQRGFMTTDIIVGTVGVVLLVCHIVQSFKLDALQREIRDLQYRELSSVDAPVRPVRNTRFSH